MCAITAWGQTKAVTGTVKDSKGEAVIGASVVAKGSSAGTITDVDGNFTLNVPTGTKTVIVSYIGMEKQEVALTGGKLNITLNESSVSLNEVVAIGYGSVKKSDLTGAISSVSAGKVKEAGRTSVLSTLQGSVPGVQIQQSSSRAGAAYSIIVRGQNSVSGSTAPLYVVDGIITTSIDFLNPQDIEKVDILKDASSTAIYGSRGSNGVVIVQTKSGNSVQQSAKTAISYDGYYGVTQKARMPQFMDSQEWMQYRTMACQYTADANGDGILEFAKADLKSVWMGNSTLDATLQPKYANGTFSGSQWLLNRYINNQSTDWAGLVTQTGAQQNHYIDISGSTKDVSYVVGLGYQNEKGIFINDDYSRYNLKGSLTANLDKHWSVGFNINVAYSTQETGSDNAMLSAFRMSPITAPYSNGNLSSTLNHLIGNLVVVPGKTNESVKDANGNYIWANSIGGGGFTSSINPLVDLASTSNNTRKVNGLGNAYLQYSPLKNLLIKSTISPSLTTYRVGLAKSTLAEGNYDNPLTTALESNAIANVENYTALNYTWDNQINYKFTIKDDHVFDLMGLYSVYAGDSEDYTANTSGYNYTGYQWYNLGAATNTANTKLTSPYQGFSMLSYAFRANYSYKGKYLVTVSCREDGSSKLAEGHKWAFFPSAALGWRMTEESFMAKSKDWLSNLKLRASVGYTGNNNISSYQTLNLATTTTYYNFGAANALGLAVGAPASGELTWEKTRELDFGVDFGFWNNRINGSVDLYDRLSSGLLQKITLPLESGAGTMVQNLGKVSNRGVEVSLNATILSTKDFTWTVNASFAANKNKIVNLFGNETKGYVFINSNSQKWMVGEDINSIYGYVYDGVWTADGIKAAIAAKDPRVVNSSGKVIAREGQGKVKDFDGNGIDPNDRRIQGHSDPSWTGGFGTNIAYKGFDFALNLYTAQGMTVFSPFMEEFTNFNDRGRQKLKMDYYIPAGTSLIGSDGYFYTTTVAHDYQGRPMVYSDNGTNSNCGPYWHQGKETANDMPGSWVNASYVKVRNISLGYSLPKTLDKVLGIQSLRFYCNVLNPFVSTKYLGFDPEWAGASMGKDNGPSTITYQFGVNLKF
jgi:TonB-linked SusC/RagA family outer membrane protein